jgi:pimeloyl-ACP methyl ester carboxylesterase
VRARVPRTARAVVSAIIAGMAASPITAVLVHSPFLGPASLRPLADALAAHGHPAVLLDLRPSVVSAPVHQVLVGAFADAISDEDLAGPVVLIGHSGAGPLLPAFADALEDTVTGLVFVDAGLPTPGRSWRDQVPAELYAQLKAASREGRLPRWQRWFSPDPLVELVADDELRAQIADEAPEVPISFLKEPRPDVEWSGPAGYVLLSKAYEADLAEATALGWPVRRLDSHHLAPATDPDPVAVAVLEVLAELLRAA